ncbi:hypothetical protein [Erwinia amylovora]
MTSISTPRSIKPVSYTHLDVYKRQRIQLGRTGLAGLKDGKLRIDPVSYTPLDVYKRQP